MRPFSWFNRFLQALLQQPINLKLFFNFMNFKRENFCSTILPLKKKSCKVKSNFKLFETLILSLHDVFKSKIVCFKCQEKIFWQICTLEISKKTVTNQLSIIDNHLNWRLVNYFVNLRSPANLHTVFRCQINLTC